MKAEHEGIDLHFGMYGKDVLATIAKNDTYDLHLQHDGTTEIVPKLEIKFCCKADLLEQVLKAMTIDSAIASKSLQPVGPPNKRYRVRNSVLKRARKDKAEVTATLRGGEVFKGRIEWHTGFEIKLVLPTDAKVILMRHALLRAEFD